MDEGLFAAWMATSSKLYNGGSLSVNLPPTWAPLETT